MNRSPYRRTAAIITLLCAIVSPAAGYDSKYEGRTKIHDSTVNLLQRKVISYHNRIDTGLGDSPVAHGTHVSGTLAGDNVGTPGGYDINDGIAYNAKLVVQDVYSYSTGWIPGLPPDLNLLFQQADDDGARIHNNSWGEGHINEYGVNSHNVDEFMWNHPDYLILHCAGNNGSSKNNYLAARNRKKQHCRGRNR